MAASDNYAAVMTSEGHAWKLDIDGEDPMGFLGQSPKDLPKFTECKWVVQIAILNSAEPVNLNATKKNVWRPRSVPALKQARTLLLLQKKTSGWNPKGYHNAAVWELPHGKILDTDADVEAALRRIVSEKTGLTVKTIMGGFVMLVVLDSIAKARDQLKLFFAVTVEELTESGDTGDVTVALSKHYQNYQWIREKRDIETLSPVSNWHIGIIDRAWAFRPEVWQSPEEYLGQAASALPYQDRYEYFVAAVISREATDGTGQQILVVKRKQVNNGEEKWELPGGSCGSDSGTVEQALRSQVRQETGLHVMAVLGQLRVQPLVSLGWYEVGTKAVIVLPYVINVEHGAIVVQEGVEWKWVQTKEDIYDLRVTRCSLKLIMAALDSINTPTSAIADSIEQEASDISAV